MIPIPIPIPIPVAMALVAAVAGAAAAWQVQDWCYTARENERAAQQAQAHAEATHEARRIEQARARNITEAQNAATQRNHRLQADADSARSELERLRGDLAALARAMPGDPASTGAEHAAAVRELLAECAGAYQELARKADGHASDSTLMLGSWPK